MAPVGSPSTMTAVPFTNTRSMPFDFAVSRAQSPGRSATMRAFSEPMVSGSNTTMSARLPTASVPRSTSPNSSAGFWVSNCTARSMGTSLRPLSMSPRKRVGKVAPHMRSRWAPASEPPIIARSSFHTSTRRRHDSGSLSLGAGHRTVRRSSATTMSSSVSNGSLPSSAAMSFTTRPAKPSFSGANVSPIT